MVSTNGRLFTVEDLASAEHPALPGKQALVARDAFNGVELWRVMFADWHPTYIRNKEMPVQIQRPPQRPPVQAVVDNAVRPLQELPLGLGIRLIAHHEPVHVRLHVLAAAGGPDQTGNRMSRPPQMPGDGRADKPGDTGQCNAHGPLSSIDGRQPPRPA